MAAIDNLETNVTALEARVVENGRKIDELKVGQQSPETEARIQAAADRVAAQEAELGRQGE